MCIEEEKFDYLARSSPTSLNDCLQIMKIKYFICRASLFKSVINANYSWKLRTGVAGRARDTYLNPNFARLYYLPAYIITLQLSCGSLYDN